LNRKDCKFIGGMFINSFTTMYYKSDAKALNLFLDDLAHVPSAVLHVSFVKTLPEPGTRAVHHEAGDNRFHVRVNLRSEINTEDLYLPDIHGRNPIENRDKMTMFGFDEFFNKPGRGWRAFTDERLAMQPR